MAEAVNGPVPEETLTSELEALRPARAGSAHWSTLTTERMVRDEWQVRSGEGRAKEAAGIVIGNQDLEAEGKTDRRTGEAEEKVDHAKDKVEEVIDNATAKVEQAAASQGCSGSEVGLQRLVGLGSATIVLDASPSVTSARRSWRRRRRGVTRDR